MLKTLKEFKVAEKGIVKKITAEGKFKRKLYDMGVTPGADIELIKFAPLGDPLGINIRGYKLTLRKSEAEQIIMEVIK